MPKLKGYYKKGSIIPEKSLNLTENSVVYITIPKKSKKSKGNLKEILEAADKTFGAIPSLPDGVEYENRIRKGGRKRIKELWGE